jgi:hypothetical protein
MSDPKCNCPTSYFSPHRKSKCLLRNVAAAAMAAPPPPPNPEVAPTEASVPAEAPVAAPPLESVVPPPQEQMSADAAAPVTTVPRAEPLAEVVPGPTDASVSGPGLPVSVRDAAPVHAQTSSTVIHVVYNNQGGPTDSSIAVTFNMQVASPPSVVAIPGEPDEKELHDGSHGGNSSKHRRPAAHDNEPRTRTLNNNGEKNSCGAAREQHQTTEGHEMVSCDECQKKFQNKDALYAHCRSTGHTKRERSHPPKGKPVDKKAPTGLIVSMAEREPVTLTCCECDRDFNSEKAFSQHQAATGHRNHTCTVCNRVFDNPVSLVQHCTATRHMDVSLTAADSRRPKNLAH